MTEIKFTAALVREVAARVAEITGGTFALGSTGSDLGNGKRYTDGHQMLTWYGPTGARQACAYYTAAAMRWARLTESQLAESDTDLFLAVQTAYRRGGNSTRADRKSFDDWESRGAERAQLTIEAKGK
jgi:hypothetical protein